MSRKQARVYSFKMLYAYLITNEKSEKLTDIFFNQPNITQDDREYMENTYNGCINNYEYINNQIDQLSTNFLAEKIFLINRSILQLAIYEMEFRKDIPNIVSINCALDIAKKYSTEKSYKYINGLLASYYKKIKNEDDSE